SSSFRRRIAMFCTNCGTQVRASARFCVGCGHPIPQVAQAPQPSGGELSVAQSVEAPQVMSAPPPPAASTPPQRQSSSGTKNCGWCRAVVDDSLESCPQCGATLGAKTIATKSQWIELPGRKDMAKLHFNNSSCQIEGLYVPVADVNLAASDSVYFS